MKYTEAETAQAVAWLRERVPQGSTVYTVLRSVSRSGMTRHIDAYRLVPGPAGACVPVWLSGMIAKALGYRQATGGSLIITGCGMDMGFNVVHDLSVALYGSNPDGSYSHEEAYSVRHQWI